MEKNLIISPPPPCAFGRIGIHPCQPVSTVRLTLAQFKINEEILRSETETLNNLVQIEKEEADVVNNYRSLVTGVVGQLERAARAQDL